MRVSLLTIGDELLIGQVVDTNSSWIAAYLAEHDVSLVRMVTVGDTHADIEIGLTTAGQNVDVILVTGGLGPTQDDLTLEALAAHTGVTLEFNEQTFARIVHIFETIIKRPLSPSHRRQAMQPAGAKTLENTQGTAPGIWLEHKQQVIVAMPGVPREMKYLMQHQVVPKLLERFTIEMSRSLTIHTAGWGESQIADTISDVVAGFDESTSIAYLPGLGTVRLRLTAKGIEATMLNRQLEKLRKKIVHLLPQHLVFGYGTDSLTQAVHQLLQDQQKIVAVAESCTGGGIGRLLTSIPGASKSFYGGVIAYDNSLKSGLLKVPQSLLEEHGAVSEQTVIEMVKGVLPLSEANVAISASGIAGPSGGTDDKPVGTIWIAAGDANHIITRKLTLGKDRETNMDYTAVAAVNLLRTFLMTSQGL